jgi:hypothetical protein
MAKEQSLRRMLEGRDLKPALNGGAELRRQVERLSGFGSLQRSAWQLAQTKSQWSQRHLAALGLTNLDRHARLDLAVNPLARTLLMLKRAAAVPATASGYTYAEEEIDSAAFEPEVASAPLSETTLPVMRQLRPTQPTVTTVDSAQAQDLSTASTPAYAYTENTDIFTPLIGSGLTAQAPQVPLRRAIERASLGAATPQIFNDGQNQSQSQVAENTSSFNDVAALPLNYALRPALQAASSATASTPAAGLTESPTSSFNPNPEFATENNSSSYPMPVVANSTSGVAVENPSGYTTAPALSTAQRVMQVGVESALAAPIGNFNTGSTIAGFNLNTVQEQPNTGLESGLVSFARLMSPTPSQSSSPTQAPPSALERVLARSGWTMPQTILENTGSPVETAEAADTNMSFALPTRNSATATAATTTELGQTDQPTSSNALAQTGFSNAATDYAATNTTGMLSAAPLALATQAATAVSTSKVDLETASGLDLPILRGLNLTQAQGLARASAGATPEMGASAEIVPTALSYALNQTRLNAASPAVEAVAASPARTGFLEAASSASLDYIPAQTTNVNTPSSLAPIGTGKVTALGRVIERSVALEQPQATTASSTGLVGAPGLNYTFTWNRQATEQAEAAPLVSALGVSNAFQPVNSSLTQVGTQVRASNAQITNALARTATPPTEETSGLAADDPYFYPEQARLPETPLNYTAPASVWRKPISMPVEEMAASGMTPTPTDSEISNAESDNAVDSNAGLALNTLSSLLPGLQSQAAISQVLRRLATGIGPALGGSASENSSAPRMIAPNMQSALRGGNGPAAGGSAEPNTGPSMSYDTSAALFRAIGSEQTGAEGGLTTPYTTAPSPIAESSTAPIVFAVTPRQMPQPTPTSRNLPSASPVAALTAEVSSEPSAYDYIEQVSGPSPSPASNLSIAKPGQFASKISMAHPLGLQRNAATANEVEADTDTTNENTRASTGRFDGAIDNPITVALRTNSGSKALDTAVQATMNRLFGTNFENVRVYDDGAVSRQVERMGAEALTIGSNIFFAPNRYQPTTVSGQALIGHELTHVLQGSSLAKMTDHDHGVDAENSSLEREALGTEQTILQHLSTNNARALGGSTLSRLADPDEETSNIERAYEPLEQRHLNPASASPTNSSIQRISQDHPLANIANSDSGSNNSNSVQTESGKKGNTVNYNEEQVDEMVQYVLQALKRELLVERSWMGSLVYYK